MEHDRRQLTDLFASLPERPCDDAWTWAAGRDLGEAAWRACERGDWLLWIAAVLGVDRRIIVTAVCYCVDTALRYVPRGESRPREAVEAARAWARDPTDAARARAAWAAAGAELVRRATTKEEPNGESTRDS